MITKSLSKASDPIKHRRNFFTKTFNGFLAVNYFPEKVGPWIVNGALTSTLNLSEAAIRSALSRKEFLKILQNS